MESGGLFGHTYGVKNQIQGKRVGEKDSTMVESYRRRGTDQ
jgi:hypothetical protein